MPLLVAVDDEQIDEEHLIDEFTDGIGIVYTFGPPYGDRLVSQADLADLDVGRRTLRRMALDNLDEEIDRLRILGQPPALMLSFDGLESSALLIDEFWDDLRESIPGDPVVGVPARDVVIITGSGSPPGVEKVRRAVDRVFFAGDQHLLSRGLLVWQDGEWLPFVPPEDPTEETSLELARLPFPSRELPPEPSEPPSYPRPKRRFILRSKPAWDAAPEPDEEPEPDPDLDLEPDLDRDPEVDPDLEPESDLDDDQDLDLEPELDADVEPDEPEPPRPYRSRARSQEPADPGGVRWSAHPKITVPKADPTLRRKPGSRGSAR